MKTFRITALAALVAAPLTSAQAEEHRELGAHQHGVAPSELRTEISAALRRFGYARPEAAALVARQFMAREDWSQGPLLAKIMEGDKLTSAPDLMAVAIYVAQARSADANTARPDGSEG